jgi:hypothetical protein
LWSFLIGRSEHPNDATSEVLRGSMPISLPPAPHMRRAELWRSRGFGISIP